MPNVDELARAEPLSFPDLSASTVIEAARCSRGQALRHWLAAAWRKFADRSGPTAVDWTAWRGE